MSYEGIAIPAVVLTIAVVYGCGESHRSSPSPEPADTAQSGSSAPATIPGSAGAAGEPPIDTLPSPQAGSSAAGSSAAAGSAGMEPLDAGAMPVDRGAMLEEIETVEPSGVPLIEREGADDFACTAARPINLLHTTATAISSAAVLDGTLHHVWAAAADSSGLLAGPIRFARVEIDGLLGSAEVVFTPESTAVTASARGLVAGHERLTFLWDYTDPNETTFLPGPGSPSGSAVDTTSGLVQLDADGMALAPARPLDAAQFPFDARLVATRDGYLAAWSEPLGADCALKIARLDREAVRVAEPQTLTTLAVPSGMHASGACYFVDLVETEAGFGIVYTRSEADSRRVYAYQAFDADGEPLGSALRLAADDAHTVGARLIAHGDGVLAAWSVGVGEQLVVAQFDATLRVARFGPDGALDGDVITVAAGREGQVDQYPAWIDLGDGAMGLAWSREQEQDLECLEGCAFSGVVEYVVIDPEAFTPRGPVLELAPAAAPTPVGISAGLLAGNADDVLVLLGSWSQQRSGAGWARTPTRDATVAVHCEH